MAEREPDPGDPAIRLSSAVVHRWHCDHLGHLNVRNYAAFFDDAVFVFWSRFGIGRGDQIVPVTAELKIAFRQEVPAGSVVDILCRVGRVGGKSVAVTFDMVEAGGGEMLASCQVVEVFFDLESRSSTAIPHGVRAGLEAGSAHRP